MHLGSSAGLSGTIQQALFMPLLTRMPKDKVKAQVVSLAPGFTAGAVLRQAGVPVYDVALSRKRFAWSAFKELLGAIQSFRPDVIQAWGHTAQLAALVLRSRCDWNPKVVWCVGETAPLPKNAGLIDRRKLKWLARYSAKVDRIVYTSEASAVLHRRAGFPDGGHVVVPPGVDPTRFKPDFAARKKVREQLGLGGDAFVIGMAAPFQTQHDHTTLIKAVGELIKTNPNMALLLAGHGVQKGNGPLMALVGGGTMGTRTHLLGEWSDMSSFFNACDIACSSSLTDSGRMTLVMAMQCGVPCVATGMGAQGEVIGQFGVAVEPGSPAAFIRGITRILQLPADKRVFMAQGARKHALTHFVPVRSMQKYLQLYFDIVGRQALAAESVPHPEIDASIPAPPPDMEIVAAVRSKSKTVDLVASTELADPDSIESRVAAAKVAYKKYKPDPEPEPVVEAAPPPRDGDVLEIFESDQVDAKAAANIGMNERARGVADDLGDLLTPEELHVDPSEAAPKPATVAAAASIPAKPVARPAQSPELLKTVDAEKASARQPPPAAPSVGSMPTIEFMMEPEDVSLQTSLVFDPPPVESLTAEDSSIQLELLADPPDDLKRAVGN
ncbi:glycosyltransferase [Povalibacter sp.]|uniref:glycosyltransferase n=1 Tax=Povalibacter sp. TaxID=1962978 RepID=UPI002F3FECA4